MVCRAFGHRTAYFERPGYYEFRVGDYQHELGLIDSRYAPTSSAPGPGAAPSCTGTSTTWRRPSRSCCPWEQGNTRRSPAAARKGSSPLSVVDPFGNVLGIMYNPHYLEVLDSIREV
jgi:hypothetical protein